MSDNAGFKSWSKIALIVEDAPDSLLLVVPNRTGRIIYEEFDPGEGKSSTNSRFYELKTARLKPANDPDDSSLIFLVRIDKDDSDMVSELKEE